MKLYMFYVGGNYGNSNVELHDVRFAVGEDPEGCFAELRRQWWGESKSLHLDCWGAVEQADGYDIVISAERQADMSARLFFVNLGGYDPAEFSELHRNVLVVAVDEKSAKDKAKAQINHWHKPHRDRLFEIEKTLDITEQLHRHGFHLALTLASAEKPFCFECDYRPIGWSTDDA